jgi:hypothetical protein
MDLLEDGVEHPVGQLERAVREPVGGDPVEVGSSRHAGRSEEKDVRASASRAARRDAVA